MVFSILLQALVNKLIATHLGTALKLYLHQLPSNQNLFNDLHTGLVNAFLK